MRTDFGGGGGFGTGLQQPHPIACASHRDQRKFTGNLARLDQRAGQASHSPDRRPQRNPLADARIATGPDANNRPTSTHARAGNPIPAAPTQPAALNIPSLKWPEVKAQLDAGKIVLVDARLKANFDIGHIPGAVLLPATSTADELRAFAEKYPKTTAFVTYCGSESCHMSHALAESLIKICGFTNVSNMPGGYVEYTLASAQTK